MVHTMSNVQGHVTNTLVLLMNVIKSFEDLKDRISCNLFSFLQMKRNHS